MLHLRAHDRDPSFGRVLAHETMDPSSERRGFIRDMFDPIARAMVDALASALPGRTKQDIWWAYEFMLGAMVYVMGDAGRIERLSGGLCRPDDEEGAVRHMVAFLTGGLRHGAPPPVAKTRTTVKSKASKGGKTHETGDLSKRRRRPAR